MRTTLEQLQAMFPPGDIGYIELREFVRGENDRMIVNGAHWINTGGAPLDDLDAALRNFATLPTGELFVGVNARCRTSGLKDDVTTLTACFTDIDGVPAHEVAAMLAKLERLPLAPSLVIHSGRGLHLYWPLVPTGDKAAWLAAQEGIYAALKVAGADRAVVTDEARVMRLVPFPNRKGGIERPTEILINKGERYPVEAVIKAFPYTRPALPEAGEGKWEASGCLAPATLEFIREGAPEGARNNALFAAACDMHGNGMAEAEIHTLLSRPWLAMNKPLRELETTIRSAISRPRNPALKVMGQKVEGSPATALAAPADLQIESDGLQNFEMSENADGDWVPSYVPPAKVAAEIQRRAGEWPRLVGTELFVANEGDGSPLILHDAADLFAWLAGKFDLCWIERHLPHGKAMRSPLTKSEFFKFLRFNVPKKYKSIAAFPHVPPDPATYYFPCELIDDGGESLREFVARFNPASDLDRELLLAALITPLWGGPCGARPTFVLTSDHGQGSGKTATVEAISDIYGGAISISATEKNWDKAKGRLLHDSALLQRCVLVDNVREALEGNDLEAIITAKVIDGHKLYTGNAARPNNLTWFVTVNIPTFSPDLVERSIPIKIGKQKHGSDFKTWAGKFIEDRRPQLLHAIKAILEGAAPVVELPEHLCDRWVAWREQVMARVVSDVPAAQRELIGRRSSMNADRVEAIAIYDEVIKLLRRHHYNPDTAHVKIQAAKVCEAVQKLTGIRRLNHVGLYVKRHLNRMPLADRVGYVEDRTCNWYVWKGPLAESATPRHYITSKDNGIKDSDDVGGGE